MKKSNISFYPILSLFLLIVSLPDCNSFNPRNAQSSLIIVHLTLQKDEVFLDEFTDPRFQKVTLQKGDLNFEFSENSENYYFFQNLKEGSYEIYDAVHLLNRGSSDFAFSSTKLDQKIDVDFEPNQVRESRVNLGPGQIIFMGTFNVKAVFSIKEETVVTVNFSKSPDEEKAAYEHLYKNFPRSDWGQKAKSKLKSMGAL